MRILGPGLWALICLVLLNRGVGPKAMVPTMPCFFRLGRSAFPRWKKYRILNLLVVGNGEPLMLMRSNTRITGGFLFLVTHQPYLGFVMNQRGINHTRPVGHQPYTGFVMNQLGINHTRPVEHQPYLSFVVNKLNINHTRPVGHQPYLGFLLNQLGINYTRLIGHQPYPGFVMNQLGINHIGPVRH